VASHQSYKACFCSGPLLQPCPRTARQRVLHAVFTLSLPLEQGPLPPAWCLPMFESLIKRQWHKIRMQPGSGTYSISQVGRLFLSLFLILMLVAGLSGDRRHVVVEMRGEDEPIFQTSADNDSHLEHMDWQPVEEGLQGDNSFTAVIHETIRQR